MFCQNLGCFPRFLFSFIRNLMTTGYSCQTSCWLHTKKQLAHTFLPPLYYGNILSVLVRIELVTRLQVVGEAPQLSTSSTAQFNGHFPSVTFFFSNRVTVFCPGLGALGQAKIS